MISSTDIFKLLTLSSLLHYKLVLIFIKVVRRQTSDDLSSSLEKLNEEVSENKLLRQFS